MKSFKNILSLVLAVCLLASMAAIAVSAVEKTEPRTETVKVTVEDPETSEPVEQDVEIYFGKRPVITDVVNSDPELQVETRRVYFYMPNTWYNDRNDNYDGESLSSCAAGVYWWSTSYNAEDYKGENSGGWPGFRVLDNLADEGQPNIFYMDIPTDCTTIVLNNTVDGGEGGTGVNAGYNYQTDNIKTQYVDVDDDPYAFYENGLEQVDDMIFVCNPVDTTINEFSQVVTQKGEWFYYYGDGKYGLAPTEEEAGDNVLANGDFPSSLQISDTSIVNYLNDEPVYDVYCNADPANLTVTVADNDIAKAEVKAVTDSEKYKSVVTVTGLKEGETSITFDEATADPDNPEKINHAFRTCNVLNDYLKPRITANNATINVGKTANAASAVKYATTVTYKSSNTKVATVTSKGVVKGVAGGKATITITARAGTKTATEKATITVKKIANPMKVTAKAISAKSAKIKVKKKTVYQLKKNATFAASKYATVKSAQGKVTYKKASGNKSITVASNGKITLKKGLKKGTYKVGVKVTAAGTAAYNAATKAITVKVTVK